MRQLFVPNREVAPRFDIYVADTEADVWDMCPWASEVIEVDGGWHAFESVQDADTWRKQI